MTWDWETFRFILVNTIFVICTVYFLYKCARPNGS